MTDEKKPKPPTPKAESPSKSPPRPAPDKLRSVIGTGGPPRDRGSRS